MVKTVKMDGQARLLLVATLILALALTAWALAARAQEDHQTQAEQTDGHGGHGDEAVAADDHAPAHGDAHGEHDAHAGPAHLANWLTIFVSFLYDDEGHPTKAAEFLMRFQDPIFSGFAAVLLAIFFARIYTRRTQHPGRLQMLAELIVSGLYSLFEIILGPAARRFTPYLGTLFLFILINNLLGLIPLMHSSTSAINTTVALAICTFCLVQGVGIKENGILGYLHHMAGSPRNGMEWGFSILLFPLHLLGEFIKPMSLSLRLFGNIFGEDVLVATMVVLGAGLFAGLNLPFGIPFQVPFVFLAMLTSTIQALVFTLLSTVYIALMLPHEEHGEEAHGH